MSARWADWLVQVSATDNPVLPHALAMQIWSHLGWSVVLACIGASLVSRCVPAPAGKLDGKQWGVALVLALWCWVPGPYAPTYWLGLAFQTPSVMAVLLCDALLRARFFPTRSGMPPNATPHRAMLALAGLGLVAGWALLLDSFALLPVQLYAWGFSTSAVAAVLVLALLPWLVFAGHAPVAARNLRLWTVPIAVLVFAAVRLPSGNVWDAVLDPLLWLALHAYAARWLWRALRT